MTSFDGLLKESEALVADINGSDIAYLNQVGTGGALLHHMEHVFSYIIEANTEIN